MKNPPHLNHVLRSVKPDKEDTDGISQCTFCGVYHKLKRVTNSLWRNNHYDTDMNGNFELTKFNCKL